MTIDSDALASMGRSEFWTALCPDLTISDLPFERPAPMASFDAAEVHRERALQMKEGHLRFEAVLDADLVGRLADGMDRLLERRLPTPFLFVYDEVWQVLSSLRRHLEALVGPGFLVGGDMWAWNVPPGSEAQGWAPHRDDQFADRAFDEEGEPNLVSIWVALTDADVDNGCMYVLPKNADPNLAEAPKRADLPGSALAAIRAQPAVAGSVLSWTADVLHWGSRSTPRATAARKSFCVYAQRGDRPRFTTDMLSLDSPVPLAYRLGFIARTMIRYRDSKLHPDLGLSPELRAFCEEHEVRLQKWLAMMAALEPS